MNINRNNYETFFLLYTDNELSAADRKLVEQFAAENPDLHTELEQLQQYKLIPDDELVFAGKETLYKSTDNIPFINNTNYESFFILYADDELTNEEKAAVEKFIYLHPEFETELDLFQKARLNPDASIVFENKEILYHNPEKRRVVPLVWFSMTAAAIVLLAIGLFWLNRQTPNRQVEQGSLVHLTPNDVQKGSKEIDTVNPSISNTGRADSERQSEADNAIKTKPKTALAQQVIVKQNQIPDRTQEPANIIGIAKNPDSTNLRAAMFQKDLVPGNGIETQRLATTTNKLDPNKIVIIDQPSIMSQPDDNNTNQISYASLDDDRLELMNTSVSKKNNLRGFLRKASRIISKTTQRVDQNGQRRSLLIGGFEIAGK